MRKAILTDTGFWIGLIDPRDPYHGLSTQIAKVIEEYNLVIAWPCLYETISTRMARKQKELILFEQYLSRSSISLVEDSSYKDKALAQLFNRNRIFKPGNHSLSLTDSVMREIITDVNINIDYLVTYNKKDFLDICILRNIDIIDE